MAKLPRIPQKIFASNAPTAEVGQFGSLAAGTPTATKDATIMQDLAQFVNGLFSVTANRSEPPRIEDFNGLYYLLTHQLAYLYQAGMAEWDADTLYYAESSFVNVGGIIYKAILDNTNTPPAANPLSWEVLLNASNITAGTLPDARLPTTAARRNILTGQPCPDSRWYRIAVGALGSASLIKLTVVSLGGAVGASVIFTLSLSLGGESNVTILSATSGGLGGIPFYIGLLNVNSSENYALIWFSNSVADRTLSVEIVGSSEKAIVPDFAAGSTTFGDVPNNFLIRYNEGIDAARLGGELATYYRNASNINAGTLADARLSANVPLSNAPNVFTANNKFEGNITSEQTILAKNGIAVLNLESYRESNLNHTLIQGLAARGTESSPASLNSGDLVFAIDCRTHNGTDGFYGTNGGIEWRTTENHTSTGRGVDCRIYNTPTGSTGRIVAARIPNNGVHDTVISSSNRIVRVQADNAIGTDGSSVRYKKDIEDLELDWSTNIIEKIRTVYHKMIDNGGFDPEWGYAGIIAEELVEVAPHLCTWGYWPEDYEDVEIVEKSTVSETDEKTGEEITREVEEIRTERVLKADAQLSPNGVQYDRIAVLMLKVMQADRQRLTATEAKLIDLEARLAKLEAPK